LCYGRLLFGGEPCPGPNAVNNPGAVSDQAPIVQAKSNLVMVPVFVFTHDGLERPSTPEEERCDKYNASEFFALSAREAYLPRACDLGEVQDLKLDDFRLFQDGQLQKIQSVENESWWVSTRDNRTWHDETSTTPNAIWSNADVGKSILPQVSHFYLLAYVPSHGTSDEGCHQIRVEVHRPRVRVFARDEYCDGQTPSDLLNGTKIGQKLEHELVRKDKGKIPLFVQAGSFRSAGGKNLVDVVLEFPWNQLNHSWDGQTGRLFAQISVLGSLYVGDGKLATRFSDLLYPAYWPTVLRGETYAVGFEVGLGNADPGTLDSILRRWDPAWLPTRYETQVELAPGKYDLKVVLSDGSKFGLAEVPVTVERSDLSSLGLSSVFLCNRFRDAQVALVETAAENFASQYAPLVSRGVRLTPAGNTNFNSSERLFAYFQIYAPKLASKPVARVQARLRVVDAKNGALIKEFPAVDAETYQQPGSTVVPIAREIPIASLPKGDFRLEVQASDSTGISTAWRAANFSIIEARP
jgi:hypothetical protein